MQLGAVNWFYFAAPQRFYQLAGQLLPWCFMLASLLAVWGLYIGLWLAPTDAQQGRRTESFLCMCQWPGCRWWFIWPWQAGPAWVWCLTRAWLQ